jgi:hypothetical protein
VCESVPGEGGGHQPCPISCASCQPLPWWHVTVQRPGYLMSFVMGAKGRQQARVRELAGNGS